MVASSDIERVVKQISSMSRQTLTRRLLHFKGDFPMDFTADYLDSLSLEKLQHILMAAYLHHQRKRQIAAAS